MTTPTHIQILPALPGIKFAHPTTEKQFLRKPSKVEWETELLSGWQGPDGSSFSTDYICNVQIGSTSVDYWECDRPANKHDWRYRLARRLHLPESWRKLADEAYRDECIECVRQSNLGPIMTRIGIMRSHIRYGTLRVTANFAWTKKAKIRMAKWIPLEEIIGIKLIK